jgi:hypothetical protein
MHVATYELLNFVNYEQDLVQTVRDTFTQQMALQDLTEDEIAEGNEFCDLVLKHLDVDAFKAASAQALEAHFTREEIEQLVKLYKSSPLLSRLRTEGATIFRSLIPTLTRVSEEAQAAALKEFEARRR